MTNCEKYKYYKMKFLKLSMLFMVGLLSSCSQTYIHIVNQGYPENKVTTITQRLIELDVNVQRSDIVIPAEFPSTVIATHPNFSQIELFNAIESILKSENLSKPQHLAFAQGRHFYNERHIGIYLRNEESQKAIMPAYLRTQYCSFADATIMFKNNGRFLLEFEKGKYDEGLEVVNGDYIFDGQRLSVTTDSEVSQVYLFHQEMKPTHLGLRSADVFKPVNEDNNLKPLNCEFLIIYMD